MNMGQSAGATPRDRASVVKTRTARRTDPISTVFFGVRSNREDRGEEKWERPDVIVQSSFGKQGLLGFSIRSMSLMVNQES